MDLPVLGEYDYKVKVIKLLYTKNTYHETGKHREYLEDHGWMYVGHEDVEDGGLVMFYSKRKEINRGMCMTDTTKLENIRFK
ncbi:MULTISPECIES: hypothetical protein [Bacillus cereus group]|uniref:hypothetical protein n=1 Tax=Bacillus cereus group TaxID=86661 RepID=UPI0018CFD570|nr:MULTISPECIES: hypothetical protein [Bacillus cereus group]MBG9840804.1 hypothetical protein [Bacillus tropicus]MBG9875337.1 hypothetical protein [Bacillus tropicus]MBG9923072.1 hypothetical protein [Bacillus tropicus]MBJ8356065.1 hypothetical protein [Bacillus mycoides]MED2902995.1 hypothetical protein [Bacillus tropicus]